MRKHLNYQRCICGKTWRIFQTTAIGAFSVLPCHQSRYFSRAASMDCASTMCNLASAFGLGALVASFDTANNILSSGIIRGGGAKSGTGSLRQTCHRKMRKNESGWRLKLSGKVPSKPKTPIPKRRLRQRLRWCQWLLDPMSRWVFDLYFVPERQTIGSKAQKRNCTVWAFWAKMWAGFKSWCKKNKKGMSAMLQDGEKTNWLNATCDIRDCTLPWRLSVAAERLMDGFEKDSKSPKKEVTLCENQLFSLQKCGVQ